MTVRTILRCAAVCVLIPAAASAQRIEGRVVAEQSRTGLADATVIITAADSVPIGRAGTDAGGFFRITLPTTGSYVVTVEVLGYAPQTTTVLVRDTVVVRLPAFVMRDQALTLDSIEARAARTSRDSAHIVGFGRGSHVLAGERMAGLERQNASIYSAVRQLGGSLRSRRINQKGRLIECVESTRRVVSLMLEQAGVCNMVAIIVDGVMVGDPVNFLRDVRIRDYESIEYVAPADAAIRYGLEASADGALVLWSRGRGPHRNAGRDGG